MLQFVHLDDPWWDVAPDHEGPYLREAMASLQLRVATFSDWLAAQPEQTIAVVEHGTYLRRLTQNAFANAERLVIQV